MAKSNGSFVMAVGLPWDAVAAQSLEKPDRANKASSGGEEALDEAEVNLRQDCEVGDGDALVDLVDRGIDETELHYGAVVLDETRIRRAAGSGEVRGAAGHLARGVGHRFHQRPGLGQEHVSGAGEGQRVLRPDLGRRGL